MYWILHSMWFNKFSAGFSGVNEHGVNGGSSASFTYGNFSNLGYSISRGEDSGCKICPRLSLYKYCHSKVTGKKQYF